MNSRDVLKALLRDGWYEVNQAGSHSSSSILLKKAALRYRTPKGICPSAR